MVVLGGGNEVCGEPPVEPPVESCNASRYFPEGRVGWLCLEMDDLCGLDGDGNVCSVDDPPIDPPLDL